MAQAKNYAGKLAIRFTYATNGQGIYGIDMQDGDGRRTAPLPDAGRTLEPDFCRAERLARPLRRRSLRGQGRAISRAATTRTSPSSGCWRPSPPDKPRILLTLATGTGKTFIAFQIAWKLFQSRWNLSREPSRRPRILFLADRNILADQAYNAFSAVSRGCDGADRAGGHPQEGQGAQERQPVLHDLPDLHERAAQGWQAIALFRRVSAGLLRFHRHRRVPSRRRQRRKQLARHPRLLRPRRAARPDRHAQAQGQRGHLRLFRRAGLHLLAQGRHQRRLPDAVQGEADFHDARRVCLYARRQADRGRDREPASATRKPTSTRSSRSRNAKRTA